MDWLIDPMDMDELDAPFAGDAAMMGATYDETWGAGAAGQGGTCAMLRCRPHGTWLGER